MQDILINWAPQETRVAVVETGAIPAAGQVTPSPKPFHPDGEPLKTLPEDEWPMQVRLGIEVYRWVGKKLLGFDGRAIEFDNEDRFRFKRVSRMRKRLGGVDRWTIH